MDKNFFLSNILVLISSLRFPTPIEMGSVETSISDVLHSLVSESTYHRFLRPNFGGPPVEINVTMLVTAISAVSEIDMDFTTEVYLTQEWNDPRLAFPAIGNITELNLGEEWVDRVWKPDTYVFNSKNEKHHLSASEDKRSTGIVVTHQGRVLYETRMTITAHCPMDLRNFPADRQTCSLELISFSNSIEHQRYTWNLTGPMASGTGCEIPESGILLPNFKVTSHEETHRVHYWSSRPFDTLVCTIDLKRSMSYYLDQIYMPAMLIVVISWIPFWLARDHHARVSLGVTTVLTMTTLATNTMDSLPKVAYMKSLDIYLFTCFLMVFMTLVEYAIVGYCEANHASAVSHKVNNDAAKVVRQTSRIDRIARAAFPLAFLCFNTFYYYYIFYWMAGEK